MERYLSIVLSEDCHISKTLMADNSYELDKYIYDHFKNSEQVRQKYSLQISSFLDENRNLIHSIEDKTNKMYRGQIVILEVNEDGTLKRIKVIYKSDVMRIKNELLHLFIIIENIFRNLFIVKLKIIKVKLFIKKL